MRKSIEIPTKVELRRLPAWALVAFAVRVAQRTRPLFGVAWPCARRDYAEVIDDAIDLARRAAQYAGSGPQAAKELRSASRASEAVARVAREVRSPAGYVAGATARACAAAAFAAEGCNVKTIAVCGAHACEEGADAVFYAAFAARDRLGDITPDELRSAFAAELRRELEYLVTGFDLVGRDDRGVAPADIGDLWADGEPPDGWAELTRAPSDAVQGVTP